VGTAGIATVGLSDGVGDLAKPLDLLKAQQQFGGQTTPPGNYPFAIPRDVNIPDGYEVQTPYNQKPDYNKLTGFEKWVMGALPGFSQSGAGKVLAWFGNTALGKALGVLDFAAEGLERGLGVFAQYKEAARTGTTNEFLGNLGAAWEAGSMWADVTNKPIFRDGKWIMPSDLPGISALVQARQQIMGGAKLEDVRGEYYNNLGSLAIRAQMHDMYLHVLGDPLNWLLPVIKPVERLHKLGRSILSRTAVPEQLARDIANVEKLTQIAGSIQNVGDIERIAGSTTDMAALGKKLGIEITADELKSLTTIAKKSANAVMTQPELLAELEWVRKGFDKFHNMTWAEQKLLQVTGNMPQAADLNALEQALDKARRANDVQLAGILERQISVAESLLPTTKLGRKFAQLADTKHVLNPLSWFRLSPQARAQEFMYNTYTNLKDYVVASAGSADEIVRSIFRAADGTVGPEFGHMVVSMEGRQTSGFLRALAAEAEDRLAGYKGLWYQRGILETMQGVLGEDMHKILNQIQNGEAAGLFTRFTEKLGRFPDAQAVLDKLLSAKGISPETFTKEALEAVGEMLRPASDGAIIPYSLDIFKYQTLASASDWAAKIGVMQFGVKQQGFLNTLSDVIKAGENLAFLRLNPSYPIRNALNNVFTMIGRGTFGNIRGKDIDKFIERIGGITPARFGTGFGAAGIEAQGVVTDIAQQGLSKGAAEISDIVRGEGKMQDFANWVSHVGKKADGTAPKWDMGALASEMEKWSSKRAWATFYQKQWASIYKPTSIYDFNRKLYESLPPNVARSVENTLRGVMTASEADAVTLADNLNLTAGHIRQIANERFGANIGEIVGDDVFTGWLDNLVAAANKGDDAITDAAAAIRTQFERSLDDYHQTAIDNFLQEQLALAKTEGPQAIPKLLGDAVDDLFATGEKHADDISLRMEKASRIQDPNIRNLTYKQILDENKGFYSRMWDRQEARYKAIKEAANSSGMGNFNGVFDEFKNWRKAWKGFFETRESLWDEFGQALAKKELPRLTPEQIRSELADLYRKSIDTQSGAISKMDKTIARLLPENQRGLYMSWRNEVAAMRASDHDLVMQFRDYIGTVPRDEVQRVWREHWNERVRLWSELHTVERDGLAALQGNKPAGLRFAKGAEAYSAEQSAKIVALDKAATQYGFDSGIDMASIHAVNPEDARFLEVPDDIMRIVEEVNQSMPVLRTTGMADFRKIVPEQPYHMWANDEQMALRGNDALEAMANAASEARAARPLKWADLPEETQKELRKYLAHVKGEIKDAQVVTTHMAEFGRDSALLDYSRRTNFDTYAAVIYPYSFWVTHTMYKWALHSIDRPAMLTTYLRLQKFMNTAGRQEPGLPSRLRGNIRISLPFLPEWMGNEVFINPLRVFLPFDNWASPYDQSQQQAYGDLGAATRALDEMYEAGKISNMEYQEAKKTQMGPVWERAVAFARQDDTEGRLNGVDFANMITSPHAPLMWAYNIANGTPEKIGPALPLMRTVRGALGLMGIDTNTAPFLSVPAMIRKSIGLPAFDQWDEYRVNRMIVNMVANKFVNPETGQPVTLSEARAAWMNKSGAIYEEAKRRQLQEFGVSAMGSALGVPTQSYPTGEEDVRKQTAAYQFAWSRYEKTGDYDGTVGKFLDDHPEYELRLALFKKPEEQLNVFLVDEIWDKYNSLPKLHKNQIRDAMPEFVQSFLDPSTRNTEALQPELLGAWLKMMGATPPGTLGSEATPINLAPPEIAQVAQFFYDYRKLNFPNYFDLQDKYFQLAEGTPRRQYLSQNPQLGDYWDWRRDFLKRNPTVIDYVSENFEPEYQSVQEMEQAYAQPFNVAPGEFRAALGSTAWEVIIDSIQTGNTLPYSVRERLTVMADALGISYFQLLEQIRTGAQQ